MGFHMICLGCHTISKRCHMIPSCFHLINFICPIGPGLYGPEFYPPRYSRPGRPGPGRTAMDQNLARSLPSDSGLKTSTHPWKIYPHRTSPGVNTYARLS